MSKLMGLEKSDDYSFLFQTGVLSILRLVVAKTDGLPGGLTGGIHEVKCGSLTEFDGADVEGP